MADIVDYKSVKNKFWLFVAGLLVIPVVASVVVTKSQCNDSWLSGFLGVDQSCGNVTRQEPGPAGNISFINADGEQVDIDLTDMAQFVQEQKTNGVSEFNLSSDGNFLTIAGENGGAMTLDLSRLSTENVPTVDGTIMSFPGGLSVDLTETLRLADYYEGTGIKIAGARIISTTLGTSIATDELEDSSVVTAKVADDSIITSKILDGTILFADLNDNGCQSGQVIKYSGTDWTCGTSITIGDIKSSIQAVDHGGWVLLDGRDLTDLTEDQQTAAEAIGLDTNLPDANNSFLVQNGEDLGSITGSNSITIARNQLPNFTLSGTTSSNGAHTHDVTYNEATHWGNWRSGLSDTTPSQSEATTVTTTSAGAHTHTFTTPSINGGVAQQQVDITPKSLSVNMFIYLGM